MRVQILANGGNGSSGLGTNGGILGGPLVLAGNPTSELEAATKGYIDTAVTSLNANNLTSGTISIARMPAMNGDMSKAAGNSNLTLIGSGVTPGTYPKVTVDSKGRVTNGSVLSVGDIPSLAWSNVASGLPTTLSGYGIGDGVSLSGGTLTGFLTLNANPTSAMHPVTKGYVDTALSATTGLSVGDVIRKPYSITPSGFLKCNGAYVSQSTYSGLFGVIGNSFDVSLVSGLDYTSYGAVGSGKPWKQQYDINTTQSTDITGWGTGTSLPLNIGNSQAIVTKNRVYLLGGHTGSPSSNIYTAPINLDGTLGTWSISTTLPSTVYESQAIMTKNRVYLLGGTINDSQSGVVYTAPINIDGTLGAWVTSASLPGKLCYSQAIVTKNRVYLLGGQNGDYVSTVYTAPINMDGTLGGWTTSTSLPGTVAHSQAIVTKNRVYLLGGYINGSASAVVYTAPINVDGTLGAWTTSTSLPGTVYGSQAIVTKNRVYLLGGVSSAVVYTAPINVDGTLGAWTTSTSLPGTVYHSQAIVTKNRVYVLGWYGSAVVYTAPISGGLNDYSLYYDGSVNKFDGTSPSGSTNPSPTTEFGLPDYSTLDTTYIPGTYSYIKV